MSHRERHGPVTDDRAAEETLKAAFQSLGDANRASARAKMSTASGVRWTERSEPRSAVS